MCVHVCARDVMLRRIHLVFNAREQEEAIITVLVGASPMSLLRRCLRLMELVNHPCAGPSLKCMLFVRGKKLACGLSFLVP